jgi:predicted nucleic acid-binding protein
VSVLWDTTIASRLYPGGAHERYLLQHAAAGDPIALATPGVLEISYGLARAGDRYAAALGWFTRLVSSTLVLVTLPLDATAAILAGRLRALQPTPPTGGGRRSSTKPEQRAAWLLDIQIAACAWSHGHALATDNRRDFDVIARLIGELYPSVSTLEVVAPPTFK